MLYSVSEHTPVDSAEHTDPNASGDAVVSRIEHLLTARGMSHTDLWKAIGMSESGYWRMMKRGTMGVDTLVAIAKAFDVTPNYMLGIVDETPAPSAAAEPAEGYGRHRYLEDRMADLETEVRKLKERLRNT